MKNEKWNVKEACIRESVNLSVKVKKIGSFVIRMSVKCSLEYLIFYKLKQ